jgi:hypothetical protein
MEDQKTMRPVYCKVTFTLIYEKDYSSQNPEKIEEVSTKQEFMVEVPREILTKQRKLTIEAGKRFYPLYCKIEGEELWQPL